MSAAPKPRVKIPKKAKVGEIVVLKTLISHEMESGQRKDKDGNTIPRKIINKFTCEFNGQPVFSCDIDPAISANPYFACSAKVNQRGPFKRPWTDHDGSVYTDEHQIEVA